MSDPAISLKYDGDDIAATFTLTRKSDGSAVDLTDATIEYKFSNLDTKTKTTFLDAPGDDPTAGIAILRYTKAECEELSQFKNPQLFWVRVSLADGITRRTFKYAAVVEPNDLVTE